jgi:hypothetical protein
MINNQQALTTIQANLAARDKHIALLEDQLAQCRRELTAARQPPKPCAEPAIQAAIDQWHAEDAILQTLTREFPGPHSGWPFLVEAAVHAIRIEYQLLEDNWDISPRSHVRYTIKDDGCCDFDTNGFYHVCGPKDAIAFGNLLPLLYAWHDEIRGRVPA